MLTKCYKWHLYHTKKKTLRDQLSTDKNKSKTLNKIAKTLTTGINKNTLPPSTSVKELADSLLTSLWKKVNKIRSEFQHDNTYNIPTRNCNTLSNFQTITEEELHKTIKTRNSTTCSKMIHVKPNSFLSFSHILVPVWTKMINKSILQGVVLQNWKEAIILPIQKIIN